MYVDNTDYFGHLVSNEGFETDHSRNDLYTIFSNPYVSFKYSLCVWVFVVCIMRFLLFFTTINTSTLAASTTTTTLTTATTTNNNMQHISS